MGSLPAGDVLEDWEVYKKYLKSTSTVSEEEGEDVHRDHDGLSMMAMSAVKDHVTHAQFIPSRAVAAWHMLRSRVKGHASNEPRFRGDGPSPPLSSGAVSHDAKSGTMVSAWWVHDFEKRRLYLGRLSVKRRQGLETAIKRVLAAAILEARRSNLREVIAWDPMPRLAAQAESLVRELGHDMTATLESRSEMVPCFRWHGGESKEVVWTESEYYGWA
ncbi:hypothetical protein TARUN_8908 [Trichoderma arundinaceum]|uniref:LYC1 C-terminal domain-containing protein n=1 Tax=Trichoderma arundinaceum TaxID=490622 RepID=A0A395NC24_TRIAR|nr:hypothetical protein TARUN_8908 [Trichoderma arundinaceum]